MLKFFTALSLVFIAAGCSPSTKNSIQDLNDGTSIIGGTAAIETDEVTKSTVALMTQYGGQLVPFCTGTLISENLVLTASHCMFTDSIQVYFGVTLPKSELDANLIRAESTKKHPQFSKFTLNEFDTPYADIALIKLEKSAPAWAVARPVLNETSSIEIGDNLILSGYGLTQEIGRPVPATGLNLVTVPVAKVGASVIVTDQTKAQGACNGDSGGPAYLETSSNGLVVVGATRGPHNGAQDCRHYGEYTSTKPFKSFIVDSALEMGATAPVFVDRD